MARTAVAIHLDRHPAEFSLFDDKLGKSVATWQIFKFRLESVDADTQVTSVRHNVGWSTRGGQRKRPARENCCRGHVAIAIRGSALKLLASTSVRFSTRFRRLSVAIGKSFSPGPAIMGLSHSELKNVDRFRQRPVGLTQSQFSSEPFSVSDLFARWPGHNAHSWATTPSSCRLINLQFCHTASAAIYTSS